MKKFLLILLALALCISMCACGDLKQDNQISEKTDNDVSNKYGGSFEFDMSKENNSSLNDMETPSSMFDFVDGPQGYVITSYKGQDSSVHIPSIYNNKKVVELENTVFSGNIKLEKIVLSDHMTTVDLSDFDGCDNLTTIIYPGEITSATTLKGPCNLVELGFPKAKSLEHLKLKEIVYLNEKLSTIDISSADLNSVEDYSYLNEKNIKIAGHFIEAILNIEFYEYFDFVTGELVYSQTPISLLDYNNSDIFWGDEEVLTEEYDNRHIKSAVFSDFSDCIEDCLLSANPELCEKIISYDEYSRELTINKKLCKLFTGASQNLDWFLNKGFGVDVIVYYYDPDLNCGIIAKYICASWFDDDWECEQRYFSGLHLRKYGKSERAIPIIFNCDTITINGKTYKY